MIFSLASRCVGTMKAVGAGHKVCGPDGVAAERRSWCTLLLHKVKCSNSCWERTLRTSSKRDYDARTTAYSRPTHRSGYLGSRVRLEAAPPPRSAHQSRHQFGSTQGSGRRGRPSRRCRRKRQWACPRHVTTLVSHRPGSRRGSRQDRRPAAPCWFGQMIGGDGDLCSWENLKSLTPILEQACQ